MGRTQAVLSKLISHLVQDRPRYIFLQYTLKIDVTFDDENTHPDSWHIISVTNPYSLPLRSNFESIPLNPAFEFLLRSLVILSRPHGVAVLRCRHLTSPFPELRIH